MGPMGLAFLHCSAAWPVSPSVPTALQAQTPPGDHAAPLWVIPLGHGECDETAVPVRVELGHLHSTGTYLF